MRIRLYFDEDAMTSRVVQALRLRSVDVIAAREVGMIERPDAEHLAYATTQNRVLYSFNTGDYNKLHVAHITSGISHAGIIVALQQRYSVGEQMRRLLKIINTKSAGQMHNSIEFLSAWG